MWSAEQDTTIYAIVSGETTEHMFSVVARDANDALYFYIEMFLDTAECAECAAETFDVEDAIKKTHNVLLEKHIEHGVETDELYQ